MSVFWLASPGSGNGKHHVTRRGVVTFAAMTVLFVLFVGEANLQKLMVLHSWSLSPSSLSCSWQPAILPSTAADIATEEMKKPLLSRPTVHEAYEGTVTFVANITEAPPAGMKTLIEENRNVLSFGLTGVQNVCKRPDGPIVLVGMSQEELMQSLEKSPNLNKDWMGTYNCSPAWGCMGFEIVNADDESVKNARWIPGNTTHIVPYIGNVFHHFADRLWPHIAGYQYPLNETTPRPINHFLVHRANTWLYQGLTNMDRNTLMYQIRILSLLSPGADFLFMDDLDHKKELVCYERLTLACTTCDRISTTLGENITSPALLRYRDAALTFFKIEPEPAVAVPPRPLRVLFYGRGDTHRRRIVNAKEIVEHLRTWKNPSLDVTFVDELLEQGLYNQSLPEVVSVFSRTDIFITVHGANTWASLFMPKHAAVLEIYGPCGPGTWLDSIVKAVELKHSTSANPWGKRVPSSFAGNTVDCDGPYKTPDFTLDITKLDAAIHQLALPIFGYQDHLTRHWMYH